MLQLTCLLIPSDENIILKAKISRMVSNLASKFGIPDYKNSNSLGIWKALMPKNVLIKHISFLNQFLILNLFFYSHVRTSSSILSRIQESVLSPVAL